MNHFEEETLGDTEDFPCFLEKPESTKRRIRRFMKSLWIKKRQRLFGRESKAFSTTSTPCSCFMCGNPRKFFKEPTLQEKIAAEKETIDRSS